MSAIHQTCPCCGKYHEGSACALIPTIALTPPTDSKWPFSTCEPTDPEPCDHDWQIRDDSFDHEFSTEKVVCWECEKCGEQKPYKAGDSNFDP